MPIPMRDSSNSEASPSMTCSPPGPKQRRISTAVSFVVSLSVLIVSSAMCVGRKRCSQQRNKLTASRSVAMEEDLVVYPVARMGLLAPILGRPKRKLEGRGKCGASYPS